MTSAERERALVHLEQTRMALLTATSQFTEEQWRYKPSPEQWCAAECVEHVALVEAMLLSRIQAGAQGPADPEELLSQTTGKEDLIAKIVPRRGSKVQAPERVRPSNKFSDATSLLAYFNQVRENTISYVRDTGDPIRSKAFPHMIFGPLDGYQWIIFMAAHTERHLNQLNEVRASSQFPAARP